MRKDNRCLDYQIAIKESEEELWALERKQNKALIRDHIRFLRLLKTGECTSQAQAGSYIGLKRRASEKLWSKYQREGIEGLLLYPYQGTKGKLTEEQLLQLQEELCTDSFQTRGQACEYVQQNFGVQYTPSGIGYVFERLKVKKKTGRPHYAGKDLKGEEQFKKKGLRS
jgi:transposase